MNAVAAFILPPPPSREALGELAAEVTDSLATVRSLWDAVRVRVPQLTTRADIVDEFLVDAMVEISALGLLEDFLFMLEARQLTSPRFMDLAVALIGRPLLGSRLTVPEDIAEDGAEELLSMQLAGALEDRPDILRPSSQSSLPLDAHEFVANMDKAIDRVCRVLIDGAPRGCGVLVNDTIIATSAHVVDPLVKEAAGGKFVATEGSLRRLEVRFPQPSENAREVACLASDWLAWYSPPAECERAKPFDVYDFQEIVHPDGPWDVALIRLAIPPAHFRHGTASLSGDETPDHEFDVTVLSYPPKTGNSLKTAGGQYLGRLSVKARLRLLHSALTIAGCSGAPCFNRQWEVFAIHQGGARDAAARKKVNRAVPVEPWVDKVPAAVAPLVFRPVVPALDGAPAQPVIGRREHQRRIHIAAQPGASAVDRLFVIQGAKGRGKSFSIRLVQHLREQGHTLCVLDLEGMSGMDEMRFANMLLGALGETAGAKVQPGLSTREREMLTVTLPDVVAQLDVLIRERPLWLAFDGFHSAGMIENSGIGQFVDGLIAKLGEQPNLRLMLTDWKRALPQDYVGAISNLDDPGEWPTIDDFVDHVELRIMPPGERMGADARQELFGEMERRVGPVLDHAHEARPRFYAELLEVADLGSLTGS